MRRFATIILSALLALTGAPVAAEPDAPQATTITVTTTADELNADGDCSLREAVHASNENKPVDACPAGSGINDVIQLGAGAYALNRPNGAGLRITQSMFLRGAGKSQTIIDGNGDRTPFQIVHDEMLVCDGAANGSVKRFNARGEYVSTLITAGSGGLNFSAGGAIVRGSYSNIDGYLYVASFLGGIKRYNRSTGAYVDTFTLPGAPGIFAPTDLTFAGGFDFNLYATNYQPNTGGNQPGVWRFNPETATFQSVYLAMSNPANSVVYYGGDFYVTDPDPTANRVLRFDGATGAPMGTFASGGGLSTPRGLTFGPDGALYVASGNADSDRVLKFNGTTGAFIGTFVTQGSGGLDRPGQIRFGPDGNLYVQSVGTQSILRYNGTTGAFIDVFVADGEGGLDRPTCFYWTTGLGTGPIANLRDLTVRNGAGAIFVGDQASLVLSDSILENNSGGFGGGIGNAGFIQVIDTIIRNNTSFNFGGGISNGSGAAAQVSGSAI
jgi:CSLREA domain-containing protein